jgi:hypothetical protein
VRLFTAKAISAAPLGKCARSLVNLKQSSQSIIVRIVKSTPLGLDVLPDIEVDLDCPKFYVPCRQRFSPYPRRINAECLSISPYGFKGERPGSTLMGSVGGLRPMVGESCRSRRTKSRSLSGLLQSGAAAFGTPPSLSARGMCSADPLPFLRAAVPGHCFTYPHRRTRNTVQHPVCRQSRYRCSHTRCLPQESRASAHVARC